MFRLGGIFINQYVYDGPVMEFGTCLVSRWKGSTFAVSEKKARNNLAYQFKKHNNRISGVKISLPGKVQMVNEYDS